VRFKLFERAPDPCENCGHVEQVYFICPACGVSFKVASETSARIFCGRLCAGMAK
jgi:hypothetical protein